jgi:hypothetical protein
MNAPVARTLTITVEDKERLARLRLSLFAR